MKIIAVGIGVAVIICVVVGYEILLKLTEKRDTSIPDEIEKAFDSYQKQQSKMEQVKKKITTKTKKES